MLYTADARGEMAGITRCQLIGGQRQAADPHRTRLGDTTGDELRHRVKCVNRLLANLHLKDERIGAYSVLASEWLSDLQQVLIAVDLSSLTTDMEWHWLRASVVVEGCRLTPYERSPSTQASHRAAGA